MAASISHFLSAITKIHVVLPTTKKCLLCFFFFSFAGLPPTFSFSLSEFLLYIPNLWSKLNTLDNTDTETISTFRFRLHWLLRCDTCGYAISRQNNLELHLGCHTCWLSYFTLVCLWCGLTGVRSVCGRGGSTVQNWRSIFFLQSFVKSRPIDKETRKSHISKV